MPYETFIPKTATNSTKLICFRVNISPEFINSRQSSPSIDTSRAFERSIWLFKAQLRCQNPYFVMRDL